MNSRAPALPVLLLLSVFGCQQSAGESVAAGEPAAEPRAPHADLGDEPANGMHLRPASPALDRDDPEAQALPFEAPAAAGETSPSDPARHRDPELRVSVQTAPLRLVVEFDPGQPAPGSEWPAMVDLRVRIVGPQFDQVQSLGAAQFGTARLAQPDGSSLQDGLYKYEVSAVREPVSGLPTAVGQPLDPVGRVAGDPRIVARASLPALPRQSGTFTIRGGHLVTPAVEPEPEITTP